jgi:hypothetical protein
MPRAARRGLVFQPTTRPSSISTWHPR